VTLPEAAESVGDHGETVTRVHAHFLREVLRTAKTALDRAHGPLDKTRLEELSGP
jgi:hypothetical protein